MLPQDLKTIVFRIFRCYFAAFLKEILGIVTLTEKEVLFYVERMMENTSKLATCPFELTREDIEKIYRESIVVE